MTNNERADEFVILISKAASCGNSDAREPVVTKLERAFNEAEARSRVETLMEVAETARLHAQFARDNNEYKASDRFEDFAAVLSAWVREG